MLIYIAFNIKLIISEQIEFGLSLRAEQVSVIAISNNLTANSLTITL